MVWWKLRSAAFEDGDFGNEVEVYTEIGASQQRFTKPVKIAIFWYGTSPEDQEQQVGDALGKIPPDDTETVTIVDVRVDLADVVKVAVAHAALLGGLRDLVLHHVQVEARLQATRCQLRASPAPSYTSR